MIYFFFFMSNIYLIQRYSSSIFRNMPLQLNCCTLQSLCYTAKVAKGEKKRSIQVRNTTNII